MSSQTMTGLEIGWLAGIVEGEGSVDASTRSPNISVTMSDEDIVRRLHAISGEGHVYGPIRKANFKPHWKSQWTWKVGDTRGVARLLLAIYPMLGQRRAESVGSAVEKLLSLAARAWGRNKCGSYAGYQHHTLRGEAVCDACRDASRLYGRESYRKRRAQYAATSPIPCECGCGELIPSVSRQGKPARFKYHHNFRKGARNF